MKILNWIFEAFGIFCGLFLAVLGMLGMFAGAALTLMGAFYLLNCIYMAFVRLL